MTLDHLSVLTTILTGLLTVVGSGAVVLAGISSWRTATFKNLTMALESLQRLYNATAAERDALSRQHAENLAAIAELNTKLADLQRVLPPVN